MRIIFNRQAYKNETSILMNFQKKYDFTSDARIIDMLKKYTNQYLGGTEAHKNVWKLIAIKDLKYIDIAFIEDGVLKNINSGDTFIKEFFGADSKVTIFGYPLPEEDKINKGNYHLNKKRFSEITDFKWNDVNTPIKINTKGRQSMAMLSLTIAVLSLVYTFWNFIETRGDILLVGIAFAILFMAIFYYLLSIGRKIEFKDSYISYRNRHNKYEMFNAFDIDHLAWMEGSETQSMVFKYHKLERNVINYETENPINVMVWAVYNEIPVYSFSRKERFKTA